MHKDCNICPLLENPSHQILVTEYWAVNLGKDQLYLGRSYVTLRHHKGRLADLTQEEWEDFGRVVRVLENAYKQAFGALPINWTCMLNHSYKKELADPHIYWHVFPRYRTPVDIHGIVFKDDEYGEHYSLDASREVNEEVLEEIAARLNPFLQSDI
jgi:diadenosine tetraphosphate (Ap4A) HIT family hydrolase